MGEQPALQAKGKTVIRLRGWVRRGLTEPRSAMSPTSWGTKLGALAPVIATQQHSQALPEVYV